MVWVNFLTAVFFFKQNSFWRTFSRVVILKFVRNFPDDSIFLSQFPSNYFKWILSFRNAVRFYFFNFLSHYLTIFSYRHVNCVPKFLILPCVSCVCTLFIIYLQWWTTKVEIQIIDSRESNRSFPQTYDLWKRCQWKRKDAYEKISYFYCSFIYLYFSVIHPHLEEDWIKAVLFNIFHCLKFWCTSMCLSFLRAGCLELYQHVHRMDFCLLKTPLLNSR